MVLNGFDFSRTRPICLVSSFALDSFSNRGSAVGFRRLGFLSDPIFCSNMLLSRDHAASSGPLLAVECLVVLVSANKRDWGVSYFATETPQR